MQAAIVACLVVINRRSPDPFIGALADKHAHLAASKQPRLLLIGGSNVAFGFQSELLAATLPYTPTNLALHASLGLDFMLADAFPDVQRDDLILLSLEYRLLQNQAPSRELWEALLIRPGAAKRMKWSRLADAGFGFIAHLCDRGLKIITRKNGAVRSGIYTRESFNKFGDVAAHRSSPPIRPFTDGEFKDIKDLGCAANDLVPELSSFVNACEARGARVVIFFPPLAEELFRDHRFELEPYVTRQKSRFGARVLGRLEDIPYPEDKFYDTCYHLTGDGSARHTLQIIERLQSALPIRKNDQASGTVLLPAGISGDGISGIVPPTL